MTSAAPSEGQLPIAPLPPMHEGGGGGAAEKGEVGAQPEIAAVAAEPMDVPMEGQQDGEEEMGTAGAAAAAAAAVGEGGEGGATKVCICVYCMGFVG
jgi:hypothetical protein